MNKKDIRRAVTSELVKIAVFVIYYFILLLFGIAVLAGAGYVTYFIVSTFISGASLMLIIFALVVLFAMWSFAVLFSIYLISPLFKISRNIKPSRVEITRDVCPELFGIIDELVDETRCDKPKHVYLSTDANACVFYDTSFWSIFFPVKKNLEIGLGLFENMNIDEIRSIIAHEFGHFSQDSMKVGSAVLVTNTVLEDLAHGNESWAQWIIRMKSSGYIIIKVFGWIVDFLISFINWLSSHMYRSVYKGYMKFSRQMEFDADNIACKISGSDVFVSALSKMTANSKVEEQYLQFLNVILQNKKMVGNYFEALRVFSESYQADSAESEVKSEIIVEDVWSSHPSLEDRIRNARASGHRNMTSSGSASAWTLIPEDVVSAVSDAFIRQFNYDSSLKVMELEEFSSVLEEEMKELRFDPRVYPFIKFQICRFRLDDNISDTEETPFNDRNARILAEFNTVANDLNMLYLIKNRKVDVKEIQYREKVYKFNELPIEEFKSQFKSLEIEAETICKKVYAYVWSRLEGNARDDFRKAYDDLFHVQHLLKNIMPSIIDRRNLLVNAVNSYTQFSADKYSYLCSSAFELEKYVKEKLSAIDLNWLAQFADEEFISNTSYYMKVNHNFNNELSVTAINELVTLIDGLNGYIMNAHFRILRSINKLMVKVL